MSEEQSKTKGPLEIRVPDSLRIINRPSAAAALGISVPTLDRRSREPDFPRKVRVSRGRIGWLESDLLAYVRRQQYAA